MSKNESGWMCGSGMVFGEEVRESPTNCESGMVFVGSL